LRTDLELANINVKEASTCETKLNSQMLALQEQEKTHAADFSDLQVRFDNQNAELERTNTKLADAGTLEKDLRGQIAGLQQQQETTATESSELEARSRETLQQRDETLRSLRSAQALCSWSRVAGRTSRTENHRLRHDLDTVQHEHSGLASTALRHQAEMAPYLKLLSVSMLPAPTSRVHSLAECKLGAAAADDNEDDTLAEQGLYKQKSLIIASPTPSRGAESSLSSEFDICNQHVAAPLSPPFQPSVSTSEHGCSEHADSDLLILDYASHSHPSRKRSFDQEAAALHPSKRARITEYIDSDVVKQTGFERGYEK